MQRIKTQRETFAYRLAADSPFIPGDERKKRNDNGANAIPDTEKERNLNALPETANPNKFEQDAAAVGENASGPRMQKMVITPSSGSGGSNNSGGGRPVGNPDASGILPNARPLYDQLMKKFPGSDIGGYRVDSFHEHDRGALDYMTSDPNRAKIVMQDAFAAGAPYVLWQQQQWNADGTRSPMEDRHDPTQNHYDHVHIAPIG